MGLSESIFNQFWPGFLSKSAEIQKYIKKFCLNEVNPMKLAVG